VPPAIYINRIMIYWISIISRFKIVEVIAEASLPFKMKFMILSSLRTYLLKAVLILATNSYDVNGVLISWKTICRTFQFIFIKNKHHLLKKSTPNIN